MNQNKVAIIGAGVMGQGLAQVVAKAGYEVLLVDLSDEKLKLALTKIELDMEGAIARWGLTPSEKKVILTRIATTTKLEEIANCGIVIEAILEDLENKRNLFQKVSEIVHQDAILITNAATLSVTDIATKTRCPERLIGMHFLNPVTKTSVVEIARGIKTSDKTNDAAFKFAFNLDKTPIQVYEFPGAITTRLFLPIINEASRVLADGIAVCEDIDLAMKLGFGFNSGPLALADSMGIDNIICWMENLYKETGDNSFKPSRLLKKMYRAGFLGKKTNRGFYAYDSAGNRIPDSGIKLEQLSISSRRAGGC